MRIFNSGEEFAQAYMHLFSLDSSALTILAQDTTIQRLAVAWPRVRRKYLPVIEEPRTFSDLWQYVVFSKSEWARIAGVGLWRLTDADFDSILHLGIVWPDGSLPERVRGFLQALAVVSVQPVVESAKEYLERAKGEASDGSTD